MTKVFFETLLHNEICFFSDPYTFWFLELIVFCALFFFGKILNILGGRKNYETYLQH